MPFIFTMSRLSWEQQRSDDSTSLVSVRACFSSSVSLLLPNFGGQGLNFRLRPWSPNQASCRSHQLPISGASWTHSHLLKWKSGPTHGGVETFQITPLACVPAWDPRPSWVHCHYSPGTGTGFCRCTSLYWASVLSGYRYPQKTNQTPGDEVVHPTDNWSVV